MSLLVGCEESGIITECFRNLGYEAYSCDLKPTSGNHPEWHLQMDVFEAIKMRKWKMGIFHPTCTFLTVSANKWLKDQPERKSGALVGEARRQARKEAIDFFMRFTECEFPWCIENPIGIMSSVYRRPDQVIQPWMFGHPERKATCLWLSGLPLLRPSKNVYRQMLALPENEQHRLHHLSPTKDRAEIRSKTYPNIAASIAKQWGPILDGYNPFLF